MRRTMIVTTSAPAAASATAVATAATDQLSSALTRCHSAVDKLDPGLKHEMNAVIAEIQRRLEQGERRHRGSRPGVPCRYGWLTKLADSSPLRPARQEAYDAVDALLNMAWAEKMTPAERSANRKDHREGNVAPPPAQPPPTENPAVQLIQAQPLPEQPPAQPLVAQPLEALLPPPLLPPPQLPPPQLPPPQLPPPSPLLNDARAAADAHAGAYKAAFHAANAHAVACHMAHSFAKQIAAQAGAIVSAHGAEGPDHAAAAAAAAATAAASFDPVAHAFDKAVAGAQTYVHNVNAAHACSVQLATSASALVSARVAEGSANAATVAAAPATTTVPAAPAATSSCARARGRARAPARERAWASVSSPAGRRASVGVADQLAAPQDRRS